MSEMGKSSSSIRVTMTAAGIAALLGSAGDFVDMFKPDIEEVGRAAGRADVEIYKNQQKINERLVRIETILELTLGMHFDGEDFIHHEEEEGVEEIVVEDTPRERRRPRARRPASAPEPDVRLIPIRIPDPEKLNSVYKAKRANLSQEQMIAPPPDIFGKEAAKKAK